MKICAVVFDLDGLMFDTEALFFRVSAETMAVRGKAFTPEMMRAMIGRRSAEVGHVMKTLGGLDDPLDVLQAEVRERFFAKWESEVRPTPGLFVLLEHLRQRELPLAVATSSGRSYADGLLSRHGLTKRFAFVLSSEDVTRGKPDPQIYRLAAERFGTPAGSILVLEDSPAGLAAAKGAGMVAVGIPHEHSPAKGLAAADLIVAQLDAPELLHLIDAAARG